MWKITKMEASELHRAIKFIDSYLKNNPNAADFKHWSTVKDDLIKKYLMKIRKPSN